MLTVLLLELEIVSSCNAVFRYLETDKLHS